MFAGDLADSHLPPGDSARLRFSDAGIDNTLRNGDNRRLNEFPMALALNLHLQSCGDA